jgi:hypothetical protein
MATSLTPGAADIEDLRRRPNKAQYYAERYSHMHTGITAHAVYLDPENLSLLDGSTFVFLAAADGVARPAIMAWLTEHQVYVIDRGHVRWAGAHSGVSTIASDLSGSARSETPARAA